MKISKFSWRRVCLAAGIFLLVIAVLSPAFWRYYVRFSSARMDEYVHTIRSWIPQPENAAVEEGVDSKMPVLTISGNDFVGLLEMASYGSVLPVCAQWGEVYKYPCVLDGSVYDGSLLVGATTQVGQYSFYREISVGDTVWFTDVTGSRYTYEITDISYSKHADYAALNGKDADLTLFIKNTLAFEYIIFFCNTLS